MYIEKNNIKITKIHIYFCILIIVLIFAGFPLLQPGYIPTHDGEYHIIRFYEFYTMLRSGYFFPRWAPGLNSGFGVPLFNFHYPLPNYVGSLFHIFGVGLVDSFKLTLFVGYGGACIACFWWLKKLFGSFAACIGATIFAFVPYWFVDIYVRGSVGEVLALAFVMGVLLATEYKNKILLSFAICGIIVSHNILAMLFVPLLFFYVLYRDKKALWFFIVGILLATYFWLPALAERSYVVGLNAVNFRDHFPDLSQLLIPSWGTGFSQPGALYDEMSQQIGVIPIFIYFLAFIFVFKEKNSLYKYLVLMALGLGILTFVLMLPVSLPLWKIVTPLQFLQYPWRLLSVCIPITGFMAAYISKHSRKWFVVILTVIGIGITYQYIRPVVYAPRNDAYYLSRREFTDGTSSLGNSFSTIWAPWKAKRARQKAEVVEGESIIKTRRVQPLEYIFNIHAIKESVIQIQITYYPGWTVFVDGKEVYVDKTNGVINFRVPVGLHTVVVHFGETPIRILADLLSIVSLLWFFILAILKSIYAYRH